MSRYQWPKLSDVEAVLPSVLCVQTQPGQQSVAEAESSTQDSQPEPTGYADGYAVGLQEGQEQGQAQMLAQTQTLTDALEQALQELSASQQALRETQTAHYCRDLSELFRILFSIQLAESDELLQAVISQVVPDRNGPINVQLSPLLAERLLKTCDQQSLSDQQIVVSADDSMQPGVLRVDDGSVTCALDLSANLESLLQQFLQSPQLDPEL